MPQKKQSTILFNPLGQRIILFNSLSQRINKQTKCDACYKKKKPVWKRNSTVGVVFICADCKPPISCKLFKKKKKKKKKKDAFFRVVLGGHFEGNRRRH